MMDGLGNRKMFTATMTALSLTDHLTRGGIIHSRTIFIGDTGALFALNRTKASSENLEIEMNEFFQSGQFLGRNGLYLYVQFAF